MAIIDSSYVRNVRGLMVGRNANLTEIAEIAEKYVEVIPGLTEEIINFMQADPGMVSSSSRDVIKKVIALLDGLSAMWLKNDGEQIVKAAEGTHVNPDICKRLVSPFVANLLTLSINIQTVKNSNLSDVPANRNAEILNDTIKYLTSVKNLIDNRQFNQAAQILENVALLDKNETARALISSLYGKDSGGRLIDKLIDEFKAKAGQLMMERSGITHCIMLVDDRPEILETVGGYLRDKYKVLPLISGSLALKAIEKQKIDLFVLDIDMPDMDGITLAGKIRALPAHKKTPIIILTGNARREYVISALKAGVNDFLIKPAHKDELTAKIAGFIRNLQA